MDEFLPGEHKSKSVTSLVFDTMVTLSACHSWQVWIGIVADDMTTLDTIAIYDFFAKHLLDFLFYTHIFVQINIDVVLLVKGGFCFSDDPTILVFPPQVSDDLI